MPAKKPAPSDKPMIPIVDLVLDPRNARKGDIPAQAESLREFGQHRPVIVQAGTNKVIAGNHLVQAAAALGWESVWVEVVDDDDEKATRRAIADNAVGDRAKWDNDVLRDLIGEVGSDIAGLDDKFLAKVLKEVDDSTPAAPLYPIIAQPGEHYSYVLIVATSMIDTAWLENAFELGKERSYKSENVGKSRAVTVEKFRRLLPYIAAAGTAGDDQ